MDSVNDKPRVLGNRYEVGDLLGRGGMAEVHIGRDTRLGRVVAIKLLRTDLARDATFQARFRREAQSAAALNHPAIVSVYDTGEEQVVEAGGAVVSLPYIVMEYVEGRTLRELMHDGQPLEIDLSLEVTARVLSALEYSHRTGIVHRDIKPANVMMTTNGDVKVMDFGIARAMADASSTMTQTQAVIGTAQYLSPEQARGETVDARSDLYSAGCLLYELLTGRPPFVADSPVAVAYQHVREEPQPPSTFNPAVPEAVDRIVLHALAKDRETRYQTADEFRADLESALAGRPVSAFAASAAAGAATTQFIGAPGAGTRTMQPVTDPVGAYGAGGIGGGMLPGAPVEEEYPYTRRDRRPEPGSGSRKGTYWAIAIALLLVGGLVAFTVTKLGSSNNGPPAPRTAAVPQVKNLPVQDAVRSLQAKGFTNVDQSTTREDTTVDPGTVLEQTPEAGTTVPLTDKITLVVAKGPGQVNLPDLRGQQLNEATRKIQDLELLVGRTTQQDNKDFKAGEVISTKPGAGAVEKGTRVDIVYASGNVKLPDLVGKSYTEALQTLVQLGLSAEPNPERRPDPEGREADTVIAQSPGASSVPVGSRVTLVLSAGPETPDPSITPSPTDTPSPSPSESATP